MIRSLPTYFTADLSAKIRWRKQFDHNPLLVTVQDKFAVRDYARQRGVETARVLHVTDDAETIPFADLPADYMLKAAHGWGWNILCREGRHYFYGDGSELVGLASGAVAGAGRHALEREQVATLCRRWLAHRHTDAEWAYRHIPPRIVVEEILQPAAGTELLDYRFYTFDGQVCAINVGAPSFRRDHLNVFFRPDWTRFELSRYTEKLPDMPPERPALLAEMVAAAERLGRGLDFVRIDLYQTTRGIVLGEMTVYPESGARTMPTGCWRFNSWLGRQWKMPLRESLHVHTMNLTELPESLVGYIRHRLGRKRTRPN
jgi:hypothetical protein